MLNLVAIGTNFDVWLRVPPPCPERRLHALCPTRPLPKKTSPAPNTRVSPSLSATSISPEAEGTMSTILLIILILLLVGALPLWPYSIGWGYNALQRRSWIGRRDSHHLGADGPLVEPAVLTTRPSRFQSLGRDPGEFAEMRAKLVPAAKLKLHPSRRLAPFL
jgi:hypothetical protein